MKPPPRLLSGSIEDYRSHFENDYCHKPLITFDDMPVYFRKKDFDHCMFESTRRDGSKNLFSKVRAERIDWIRATLQNSKAELYQGWDRRRRRPYPDYRVAVAYEHFVVVIRTSLDKRGGVKATFTTAYSADKSIDKIRRMPRWDKSKCRWFAKLAQRQKPL